MRRRARVLVGATALALSALSVTVPTAQAHDDEPEPGETSLAEVLTSDGNRFDRDHKDFDIVTEAALAVIEADPESPVALIADGSQPLTAFAPTDRAFRLLVKDLTGTKFPREKKVFNTVASLGLETVETVLLYHVVAGQTLTSDLVLESDGAKLETAAGLTVRVDIETEPRLRIFLRDKDRNDDDPRVLLRAIDINEGNQQVAHGISRVLRPTNL